MGDAKALDAFINSLLVDDRPERVGFHFEALAQLIEIQQVRIATLTHSKRVKGRAGSRGCTDRSEVRFY